MILLLVSLLLWERYSLYQTIPTFMIAMFACRERGKEANVHHWYKWSTDLIYAIVLWLCHSLLDGNLLCVQVQWREVAFDSLRPQTCGDRRQKLVEYGTQFIATAGKCVWMVYLLGTEHLSLLFAICHPEVNGVIVKWRRMDKVYINLNHLFYSSNSQ